MAAVEVQVLFDQLRQINGHVERIDNHLEKLNGTVARHESRLVKVETRDESGESIDARRDASIKWIKERLESHQSFVDSQKGRWSGAATVILAIMNIVTLAAAVAAILNK